MPAAVYILFGAVFTVATAIALGRSLLRVLRLPLYPLEDRLFSFLAGSACLSTLVFALCTLHLARKGIFLMLGGAAIGWAIRNRRETVSVEGRTQLGPVPRGATILFLALFCILTVFYFFNAMAPETSPDGSSYHLGLVDTYHRAHGFERITYSIYAALSQGIEMLFLFAYTFGKHSAAALVHFSFLAALPLLILGYARTIKRPVVGVAAALLVYASPVVAIDGTSAYIDVAVTALLFGVFYVLQIWDEVRNPRLLMLAGLLAGFAFAAKYTAFLALPFALGFILLRERRFKALIVTTASAAIPAVPWLVKNWIWLANPVAPFFNSVMPNPYFHILWEKQYQGYMRNTGFLTSYWQIPMEVTVHGEKTGGLLGPVFLLAPIALWALRWREGRRLLCAWLIFTLPYLTNTGTRFLIPGLPFLALAMALAIVDWPKLLLATAAIHCALALPVLRHKYSEPYAWSLERMPLKAALRIIPEEQWLRDHSGGYEAARMVERWVPAGKRVFAFNQIPNSYTTREIWVRYESAKGEMAGDIAYAGIIDSFQPLWLRRFSFAAQTIQKLRAVQTAKGSDIWSIAEFHAFLGAKEIEGSAGWRVNAAPNPWDAKLAFDRNPVTRWRSWEAIRPGMHLDIDFGKPEQIDAVLLEGSFDQWQTKLRLEGLDASGQWRLLSAAPLESTLPKVLDLRRQATREMQARGIDYLLVMQSDYGSDDFDKNRELWGLKLLRDLTSSKLYEIVGDSP